MNWIAIAFTAALAAACLPAGALDAGFALPPEIEKRVSDGIEANRKSPADITVVDSRGRPVEGAEVRIRQVSHDFLFGCAFPSWDVEDPRVGQDTWNNFEHHFLKLFNYLTTENMLKWPQVERENGERDYTMPDHLVRWARRNKVTIKGHCLVWGLDGHGVPKWLKALGRDEVLARTEAHVRDLVRRYRGDIDIWDVVNEPLQCLWFAENMSPDYIRLAHRWARESNPGAMLIINQYGTLWDAQAEKFARLCSEAVNSGVPVDAIGEQAHDPPRIPSPEQLFAALDTLAGVGLDVHLTEITMPSNDAAVQSDFVSGNWDENLHGDYYRYLFTLAFSHKSVKAITLWAMWDGASWLDRGGIIAKDWRPKKAYRELDRLINREWRTSISGETGGRGTIGFRGFHGNYTVSVSKGACSASAGFHLKAGGPNKLTIRLD